jgi:hypothetical protein
LRTNAPHKDLVLLETLGLVLRVGTSHYIGETIPKKESMKMGRFPHFYDFCFHNTNDFSTISGCIKKPEFLGYLIPYVVSINCGGAEAGIHIQM